MTQIVTGDAVLSAWTSSLELSRLPDDLTSRQWVPTAADLPAGWR